MAVDIGGSGEALLFLVCSSAVNCKMFFMEKTITKHKPLPMACYFLCFVSFLFHINLCVWLGKKSLMHAWVLHYLCQNQWLAGGLVRFFVVFLWPWKSLLCYEIAPLQRVPPHTRPCQAGGNEMPNIIVTNFMVSPTFPASSISLWLSF